MLRFKNSQRPSSSSGQVFPERIYEQEGVDPPLWFMKAVEQDRKGSNG